MFALRPSSLAPFAACLVGLACRARPDAPRPLAGPHGVSAAVKPEILKRDPVTGLDHTVLEGVELGAQSRLLLDMKWTNALPYSFIPASAASALQAEVIGPVDLGVDTPEVPALLEVIYGMNRTCQRVFSIVRIESVDLGVGPTFGPVQALVLEDVNTALGVIGRDWASFRIDDSGFSFSAEAPGHPYGAVYWQELAPMRR